MVGETYLDLDFLINGAMDTLLLILVGRFIHLPVKRNNIFLGTLLGEIPVVLACCSVSPWSALSKWIIPFLMIGAAFPTRSLKTYLKALIGFWLLSAGLGGFVVAWWGWLQVRGEQGAGFFSLTLSRLWVLPTAVLMWWLLQGLWQRWQERDLILEPTIHDLVIDFGEKDGKVLRLRGMLDTGNHLRDPLTGQPVILVEEKVVIPVLPETIKSFLEVPWKECADPWPLLWRDNPCLVKHFVFIPFQAIERKSWLLGIRPVNVAFLDNNGTRPIQATVALVQQVLSTEGRYQALLHPEHMQKGGDG
jgi:stage II sporulation protein GA (sporulation sigma-E factor processing peptidase)